MTRDRFLAHLRYASSVVHTWPAWKQRLLGGPAVIALPIAACVCGTPGCTTIRYGDFSYTRPAVLADLNITGLEVEQSTAPDGTVTVRVKIDGADSQTKAVEILGAALERAGKAVAK